MNPFYSKKRVEQLNKKELAENGVLLSNVIPSYSSSEKLQMRSRAFICILRGLLVFFASFGTVGALVSAFGLNYYYIPVIGTLLLLAMFTAFLYYNRVTFYAGYFVLFLLFTVSIFASYWYVNSGFQAFTNTVYEKYSDYFHLLTLREATEFITNRTLTISVTMVFVGFFLCILLNITISGYMNLVETFLFTFPLLQIALYIDAKPALPYLAMLLSVYITVGLLGRSGHYQTPSIKLADQAFHHMRKKNRQVHSYISDGKSMLTTGLYSIIFSGLFLVLTFGLFYSDFGSATTQNQLKNTTDEYVKSFVQSGFSSLFNRYDSTGGLNHGQLGGVGSVRPDYQTDLTVSFVPYSYESIYLKGFVGTYYTTNRFLPLEQDPRYLSYIAGGGNAEESEGAAYAENSAEDSEGAAHAENSAEDSEGTAYAENSAEDSEGAAYAENSSDAPDADYWEQLNFAEIIPFPGFAETLPGTGTYAKMYIQNIDADNQCYYMPYDAFQYTDMTTRTFSTSFEAGHDSAGTEDIITAFHTGSQVATDVSEDSYLSTYEILYEPYNPLLVYPKNEQITSDYASYVYNTYLQVPESIKEELLRFWEESDLPDYSLLQDSSLSDAQRQQIRLNIAGTLKSFYIHNFEYTMAPGATPRNQDTILYFLQTQKRGYCAHFASASVMLLRSVGIPARYVEGYMIPMSSVNDGTLLQTDTSEWYLGKNELSETAVVSVNITDAQAHAWVEIYIDDYGWIPFEFTPPSDDSEMTTGFDFMSLLSGLVLTGNGAPGEESNATEFNLDLQNLNFQFSFLNSFGFLFWPLLILLAVVGLTFTMFQLRHKIRLLHRCKKAERKQNYNDALMLRYQYFYLLYCKNNKKEQAYTPREIFPALAHILPECDCHEKMQNLLYAACFSQEITTRDEYNKFCQYLKNCRKACARSRQ
ncbi:MAG: transglutaminase family protein [Lachnospiraceae bacterium]